MPKVINEVLSSWPAGGSARGFSGPVGFVHTSVRIAWGDDVRDQEGSQKGWALLLYSAVTQVTCSSPEGNHYASQTTVQR